MIVRIGNNDDYMEKLSAQPKLINATDKLGLEHGKHAQAQMERDTIHIKYLIEDYPDTNLQYHIVSNLFNVVSNDIKQNISSMYIHFYTNKHNNMAHCLTTKYWTALILIEAIIGL